MSSTERAPEPTMEEILASIRRIITDDEAGQAQTQNATPKAQAEDESLEGEADNQIIDDIARVLSGDAAEAPASEEEEILDLAAELGGLEIVEDDGDAVVEVTEVREFEQVFVAGTPEPQDEQPQDEQPQDEALVFTQPEAEESAPEPIAEMPQPQEEAQPAAPPVPPVQSAGEEAASALERAIAALRAGQTPAAKPKSFSFEAAPQPDMTPAGTGEPEPIPMAVPMASPEVEEETHPEPEPVIEPDELDFEAQPEIAPTIESMTEELRADELMADEPADQLVLTEAELTLTEEVAEPETGEKPPFWPVQAEAPAETEQPAPGPEPVFQPEPVFVAELESEPEPELTAELVVAPTNGAEAHHDVAGKTLEDSIKDMLRPMLRQWLDENMPRMIREGFDPETLRRRQD